MTVIFWSAGALVGMATRRVCALIEMASRHVSALIGMATRHIDALIGMATRHVGALIGMAARHHQRSRLLEGTCWPGPCYIPAKVWSLPPNPVITQN
eukprot:875594-Pelagomonas_calceolata.AAC.4